VYGVCATTRLGRIWSQSWVVRAARCIVPRRCCGVQRPGVLKHTGTLAECTIPCILLDACGGRCIGQCALVPAVQRRAPRDRCAGYRLEAHAGCVWGTRGPPVTGVATCRRPSRSSPCSARHAAAHIRTRTAHPENLIVPRSTSESRTGSCRAFGAFSARPDSSGR
jgi:hypothetical protein